MERVIVTGLGCVSSLGNIEELWSALVDGRSGIGPITSFSCDSFKTRIAGEVKAFNPVAFMPQREVNATSRCVQFGVAVARMAIAHSGLDLDHVDLGRVGVYLGTSIGPLALALEQHAVCLEKGISRVHPMAPAQNHTGVLAAEVSILLGLRGPAMTLASACTSGADALGIAMSQIRSGVVDVAIAGASEAPLFPTLFAAFDRLALMSRRSGIPAGACRPFALDRDGIVLAEGAAACVLEAESHARRRRALMLAELAGFAATSDAYHHFQQRPDGEEAVRAIRGALNDAKVSPVDVDYVSAHGTGTQANDAVETRVIKQALGGRSATVPISSIKSMTGHLMGACAALEAIACVKGLQDQTVPPTINLEVPDPACDLDYVPNESRRVRMRTILSNSFGFGSRNAALVFRSVA